MRAISRRRFLSRAALIGGAIPFHRWIERTGFAQAGPNRIRYGIHTSQGKANLETYARGFEKMRQLGITDPLDARGLGFQRRIHMYPASWQSWNTDQENEPARKAEMDAYFATTDPARAQEAARVRLYAQKTWGKCAHSPMPDFFVWHRMYIFFFEQCLRALTSTPEFTLPYWGYSSPKERKIPDEFRAPNVGYSPNPLWHARTSSLNDPVNPTALVDQNFPDDDYWATTAFKDFTNRAQKLPHNAVHNDLGNPSFDMGTVVLAPADPIFWVHHCEIDRIWYSWSKAGGNKESDQSVLDKDYYFIDGAGQLVTHKGRDVLETDQLLYDYDEAIPKPSGSTQPVITELSGPAASSARVVIDKPKVAVELTPDPQFMTILTEPADQAARRWILSVEGLTTTRTISANLDVFVNMPETVPAGDRNRYFAGRIALFGHQAQTPPIGDHGNEPPTTFDITRTVVALKTTEKWNATPRVSIVVAAGGLNGGVVIIDRLRIVAR